MKKLKLDCFVAIFVPVIMVGIFHFTAKDFHSYELLGLGTIGVLLIIWYLYRFFNRLEDMTWQQQLSNVIQKVTAPVLIANLKHKITYVNESFYHLPLAAYLEQFNTLPELMLMGDDKNRENFKKTLDGLTGKIKDKQIYNGKTYEWVIVPLLSPAGKRWGTLVECTIKNEQSPTEHSEVAVAVIEPKEAQKEPVLSKALEQHSHPFAVLDRDLKVKQINISLGELLKHDFNKQDISFFRNC